MRLKTGLFILLIGMISLTALGSTTDPTQKQITTALLPDLQEVIAVVNVPVIDQPQHSVAISYNVSRHCEFQAILLGDTGTQVPYQDNGQNVTQVGRQTGSNDFGVHFNNRSARDALSCNQDQTGFTN